MAMMRKLPGAELLPTFALWLPVLIVGVYIAYTFPRKWLLKFCDSSRLLRRRVVILTMLAISLFILLVELCCSVSSRVIRRSVSSQAVVQANFPDPSILKVGNTWYSFATQVQKEINVQVASSSDFQSWTVFKNGASQLDALPTLPPWVDKGDPRVWAPDVIQRDDGTFVLYFTAATASNTNLHCLSYATSSTIQGPYGNSPDQPWICPLDQGGAIDISGFRDSGGQRYVVYKIDGNAIGHGGSCNNGVEPRVDTPLMLQAVEEDGITFKQNSPATAILHLAAEDGPVIEAPSIMRAEDGKYVLFFSQNCYTTTNYNVAYAISSSGIGGPYQRSGVLFKSGDYGLNGPGGASVWREKQSDGWHMVFHANSGAGRSMWTAVLKVQGNQVSPA